MYALQWLESERAVMYDPAHADFFLRDKSGAIYNAPAKEGDQYLWNYSNPAAARYKMDVVICGEGGVGAPGGLIDGIFLDDPFEPALFELEKNFLRPEKKGASLLPAGGQTRPHGRWRSMCTTSARTRRT